MIKRVLTADKAYVVSSYIDRILGNDRVPPETVRRHSTQEQLSLDYVVVSSLLDDKNTHSVYINHSDHMIQAS